MARLSKIDWENLQAIWERDERTGYRWMVKEFGLKITDQAIRNRAIRHEWQKRLTPQANKPKTTKPTKPTLTPEGIKAESPEAVELTEREQLFVAEYTTDFNATRAGKAVGYSPKSAETMAFRLLRKDRVQRAIKSIVDDRKERLGIDGDDIMRAWWDVVNFDVNEIVQYRRIPCPFCYAKDDIPQYTKEELIHEWGLYEKNRLKAQFSGIEVNPPPFRSLGVPSVIDESLPPNEDCKACGGLGMGKVMVNDTTTLSPIGKRVYCGCESSENSLKVLMLSKERALENLAKALGLFNQRIQVDPVKVEVDMDELANRFTTVMKRARERAKARFSPGEGE